MFDNLVEALLGKAKLFCPLDSALVTERIVEGLLGRREEGGGRSEEGVWISRIRSYGRGRLGWR